MIKITSTNLALGGVGEGDWGLRGGNDDGGRSIPARTFKFDRQCFACQKRREDFSPAVFFFLFLLLCLVEQCRKRTLDDWPLGCALLLLLLLPRHKLRIQNQ